MVEASRTANAPLPGIGYETHFPCQFDELPNFYGRRAGAARQSPENADQDKPFLLKAGRKSRCPELFGN